MKTPVLAAACLLVPALAGAQVRAQAPVPVPPGAAVEALRVPPPPPTYTSTLPGSRQTGAVQFEVDGTPVTVRSWQPDATADDAYRISFEALDDDGDGAISRAEAAAHPRLGAEFNAVDADRDGRASRAELSGWTVTD